VAITTSRAAGLPIGALSRHTGCNVETIRYYERVGVLPRPPRTGGGQRVYDARHVARLSFVRRARELGFTLRQVRELARLAEDVEPACMDVRAITVSHLGDVRRTIADLRRLERVLAEAARRCEAGDPGRCPIIDALSRPQPAAAAT
jgi:MerR family mercuric resistance operon transcriptional regulator